MWYILFAFKKSFSNSFSHIRIRCISKRILGSSKSSSFSAAAGCTSSLGFSGLGSLLIFLAWLEIININWNYSSIRSTSSSNILRVNSFGLSQVFSQRRNKYSFSTCFLLIHLLGVCLNLRCLRNCFLGLLSLSLDLWLLYLTSLNVNIILKFFNVFFFVNHQSNIVT